MCRRSLCGIVSAVHQNVLHKTCAGHKNRACGGRLLQLSETLVTQKEECLVLLDWPAHRHAVLTQPKREDGGYGQITGGVRREIVEIAGVENGIPEIAKNGSVEIIRARLGDDVDLAACLSPILNIIKGAIHAILFDGILGDLQTDLGFLRLLLHAASIHTVEAEVVVVTGAASEADRALVSAAVVLRERRE